MLVGLTGGLAAGKDTIADFLRELGAYVIDADKIAREILQPGREAYGEAVDIFGNEILCEDGNIDRKRLAGIVFSDPARLKALNKIMHPRIIEEEKKIADDIAGKERDAIIVINAALLIESGHYKDMDKIIVVDIPKDIQMERAIKKGYTRDDAAGRIRSQLKRDVRRAYADIIIDNSGSMDETKEKTRKVFEQLMEGH